MKFAGHFLRIASRFVGAEEERPILHNVLVEPAVKGGVLLVASDGKRLICIHDADGVAEHRCLIRVDRSEIDLASGRVVIRDGRALVEGVGSDVDLFATAEIGDAAAFPEWRRIVPPAVGPDDSVVPPAISLVSLADLAWAGRQLARGVGGYACIYPAPLGQPMLVRWMGVANAFAVQVPMKVDPADGFLPPFMVE